MSKALEHAKRETDNAINEARSLLESALAHLDSIAKRLPDGEADELYPHFVRLHTAIGACKE